MIIDGLSVGSAVTAGVIPVAGFGVLCILKSLHQRHVDAFVNIFVGTEGVVNSIAIKDTVKTL